MHRAALLLLAAVLVLPGVCRADDEAWVNALHKEFEERDLTWAAKLYRELGDERATYRLIEVVAKANQVKLVEVEAKRFLARFPRSRLQGRVKRIAEAPAPFVAEQIRKRNTERKRTLRDTKLNLELDGVPLGKAMQELSQRTGLTFVLLPEADPSQPVVARVQEVSGRSALRTMLAPYGLTHAVSCGAVVIGKAPESLLPPAFSQRVIKRNPEGYLALKALRVALSFDRTPLGEALAFMKETTGQVHELGAGLDPGALVSLHIKDVTFEEGLTLLTAQVKATYVLTRNGLRIRPVE